MFGLFKVPERAEKIIAQSEFDACVSHVFTQKANVIFAERGENSHLTKAEALALREEAVKSVETELSQMENGWNKTRRDALRQLSKDYGLKVN